jgi:hypothetical protein
MIVCSKFSGVHPNHPKQNKESGGPFKTGREIDFFPGEDKGTPAGLPIQIREGIESEGQGPQTLPFLFLR